MSHSRIITKYLAENHNGESDLRIDFDKIGNESVHLDMELVGAAPTDIFWEIYSNGKQLDNNDLTKGKKAELIILKTYAGPSEHPHEFRIFTRDAQGHAIAQLKIFVFALPKITDAFWVGKGEKKIYEASSNESFSAYFKGFGLYNAPLIIRFYFKSDDGNDVEISEFARTVTITTPYDLADFYIDKETLKENYKFFLRNLPKILMDYLSNQQIAVTGKIKNTAIAKAYFTISYNNQVLFHGKREKELINLIFDLHAILPSEPVNSITPVFIAAEEYFTQKYEPCKYEKVFYKNGKKDEVPVFDEEKPVKKDADGNFTNSKIEISAIVPPQGSKNSKELKIRLENVKTDDCSLLDENKEQTNISPENETENKEPHKGRVINTKELDNANIEYTFETVDKKITIKPTFDYLYDEKSPWEFLKNYFLFSATLSNLKPLENSFKGVLMDSEIERKGLIQKYRIPLETCRYRKNLWLITYPDVAWAFHALLDNPYIPEFYMSGHEKTIVTVTGLEEEIEKIKKEPIFGNFVAPIISPAFGSSFIRDFALDIFKDIAEKYEMGFTAYYDFDNKDKNQKQIDYAKTNPEVFKGLIFGIASLEVLIDVLLIILTEGAALGDFLSKAGKVASVLGKAEKVVKVGERAEKIASKYSKLTKAAEHAKWTKEKIELLKGSYYRAYRFLDDPAIGIDPVIEERCKISPLIKLAGVSEKKSLGKYLLNMSPAGMTLNLAKDAAKGFELGMSSYFLSMTKKGRNFKDNYDFVTYPLKVVGNIADGVYELLAFTTDRAVEEIFGAKAEIKKDIVAHMDLDFWLKIHNKEKKLIAKNFLDQGAPGREFIDKSSISLAPSGVFTVRVKISGSVTDKAIVRAMNVLTWHNKDDAGKVEEMTAEGKLEVSGNVFVERRYFYTAEPKPNPHYRERVAFLGLGGEYEYKIKANKRYKDKVPKDVVIKTQNPKKFMLIEPCELNFNSSELTKNPGDEK